MRVYKRNMQDNIINMFRDYFKKHGEFPDTVEMTQKEYDCLGKEVDPAGIKGFTHFHYMEIVIVEEKPRSPKR